MARALSPIPEIDNLIHVRFEEFRAQLQREIMESGKLPESYDIRFLKPTQCFKKVLWTELRTEDEWSELLAANFETNDLIVLDYIVKNRWRNKYWWTDATPATQLTDNPPPGNLSRKMIFHSMIGCNGLAKLLANHRPAYKFTFEGPDNHLVLRKTL